MTFNAKFGLFRKKVATRRNTGPNHYQQPTSNRLVRSFSASVGLVKGRTEGK
jgi:hypothetical protein